MNDAGLLSRLESAGLNASAPPQQRWLDGWLLRYLPGKARRARCINALAPGQLPLAEKLALAEAVYREAGLPLIFRSTRFTAADSSAAVLQPLGFEAVDPTDVMGCRQLPTRPSPAPPAGLAWRPLDAGAFAEVVGALRGTPPQHRRAHALRLAAAPVPHQGFALVDANGDVRACGQFAREGDIAGLYDVFTHPEHRGRGLAQYLCEHLLTLSAADGASMAYLQVEHGNLPAQKVYRRLGFDVVDGYCYLQRP